MCKLEKPADYLPSADTVKAAYVEILAHNGQYTGFEVLFAQAVEAVVEGAFVAGEVDVFNSSDRSPAYNLEEIVREQVDNLKTEGDMYGELQRIVNKDIFSRIGLVLMPGNFLEVLESDAQPLLSQEITPILYSSELFTVFLKSLNPEMVNRDEDLLYLVADVLANLQEAVVNDYGESVAGIMPEDVQQLFVGDGEDSLRHFIAIDEALQELGLNYPALYEQCLKINADGCLEEQILQRYHRAKEYMRNYKELEDYIQYWARGLLKERLKIGSVTELQDSIRISFDNLPHKLIKKIDNVIELASREHTFNYGLESAEIMIDNMCQMLNKMREESNLWAVSEKNHELLRTSIARLQQAYIYNGGVDC